jgi:predicted SAM-dependent methyltransferase
MGKSKRPYKRGLIMSVVRFNLGGIGKNNPDYKTVNLAEICDIEANIMDLDSFCKDNSVDEFFLSHTLEHIPVTEYKKFLLKLKTKLKKGGVIRVIQTDVGRLVKMWTDGEISFRAMRAPIFTPASRCESNILQQHQSMWSQEELIKDFQSIGMEAEGFDAGFWQYDIDDDMIPEETKLDYGKNIPNLGVIATK